MAQLVAAANEVLDRAVVFERENGGAWSTSPARARTSGSGRSSPHGIPGSPSPGARTGRSATPASPKAPSTPTSRPAHLDQWATTHITAATSAIRWTAEQNGTAERMVSDGLARHSASSEAASIARQARYLAEHGATDEQREQYEARKAAVLGKPDRHPNHPAGCSCRITDPGGPHEARIRDDRCPVHRGR